jgi:ribonuclease VapC
MTDVVVDTSVVLAIYQRESGYEAYRDVVASSSSLVSAVSRVEAGVVVLSRKGTSGLRELERLIDDLALEVVPVDAAQTGIALDALERYGKGRRRPPAVLNFGDLFSYALARSRDMALLYVGGDFAHTDIRPALPKVDEGGS